jgi:hypothetical protein
LADGFKFCPECGRGAAEETAAARPRDPGIESSTAPASPPTSAHVQPPSAVAAETTSTRAATKPVVVLGVAAAIILLGVVIAIATAGGKNTLTGTMTLVDPDGFSNSVGCEGSGGYDDISFGTDVRVSNGEGELIGTGSLGLGSEEEGLLEGESVCVFEFEVADLPNEDFYEIEVSHRGGLTYSADEMDEMGWAVDVSLG